MKVKNINYYCDVRHKPYRYREWNITTEKFESELSVRKYMQQHYSDKCEGLKFIVCKGKVPKYYQDDLRFSIRGKGKHWHCSYMDIM